MRASIAWRSAANGHCSRFSVVSDVHIKLRDKFLSLAMSQHDMKHPEAADAQLSGLKTKLELFHFLTRLKTQKRTGWVLTGVRDPESIADHMYRMAALALLSDDETLDINRCVSLAIVHDMAEAETGDIAPRQGISKEQKEAMETAAMERFLTQLLPADSPASKRIRALWREYEDRTTPEARFVKDLDLFELGLQAVEYERDQDLQLQEFFESTQHRIKGPELRSWSRALLEERRQHWAAKPDQSGFVDLLLDEHAL